MQSLNGKNLRLRAMEPSDIDLMYEWENDPETWIYSNTTTPFSRFYLEQYIINSHCDIYSEKQLRLMIETRDGTTLGCIDMFEFDPKNRRAGIGILIAREFRKKGFASESLDIIINYAKNVLALHQLFCNISHDNKKSLELFKKKGFREAGQKKQWLLVEDHWVDEHFLQLIFA
ncbi:MAG: GNAT family N-acetyltransferase [Bacteroidota bacterium]